MKQWKPLVYFLILNILVSAVATFLVLTVWDRTHKSALPVAAQVSNPQNTVVSSGVPVSPTLMTQAVAKPSTPTETPEPTMPENVEEYEVQSGDTLGLIAEKYDISVNELMRVNAIKDPNSLSVGMVIYVPLPADKIPTATPKPTSTSTPVVSGSTTSSPPQEARVIINSVIGVGELASEHVFITRSGDGDLSLEGWKLEDENGNVFIFPKLQLFKDGAVNVWTTSGAPTVVDLYWGLQAPVWSSGETVTMRDAQGKVRATYKIP
jgi:LysM repeat protein